MSFGRPLLCMEMAATYEDQPRSSQVLNEMHRFYQDENLCDMVLLVEGSRFPCHRLVLAASSMYFERMFSTGMTESTATEVTLNDVPSSAVKQLIEFAYTSKLSLSRETVLDVFESADMLQFLTAMKFCQTFLQDQITLENCLHFMLYADAFSCDGLYERGRLCAAQNFKVICNCDAYFKLPVTHLINLLIEGNLEMEYEEHVYEAMRRWIEHDKCNRLQYYGDLFKCIRLNFISRWYLNTVINVDDMLESSRDAQVLLQKFKDHVQEDGHHQDMPWQLPPSRKNTGMTEKIIYLRADSTQYSTESEMLLYDPVNNSWSKTSKSCPLATGASTLEHYRDSLLVLGGWNSNLSTNKSMNQRGAVNAVHEYKLMTIFPTLWYTGEHPIGLSRYLHSSIVVGKYLYVMGGLDETQSLQATMYVSDREQQYRFKVCPRMPSPVCRPALAHWSGFIYVFGGFYKDGSPLNFVQSFDIARQRWRELSSMNCLNIACQYAVCIDNHIYLFCGDVGDTVRHPRIESSTFGHGQPTRYFDCIKSFDPIRELWRDVYFFSKPRCGDFSITRLRDKVYITGGIVDGMPYKMVDCYDPQTNTLETVGEAMGTNLSLCTTMKVMHENFGL